MKFTIILFLVLISVDYIFNAPAKKANKLKKAKKQKTVQQTLSKNALRKTIERKGYFGGDMKGYIPPQKGALRVASTVTNKWVSPVPYSFESKQLSSSTQKLVLQAMAEISSKTCLKFVERTKEKDYIYFIKDDGCYSYVGCRGGKQEISIGRGCEYVGTCIHEIFHALGFFHTQMRTDRDTYLQINLQNVEPSAKSQFDKLPAYACSIKDPFDYNSIMIYGPKSFSYNGRETMVPKKSGARISDPYFKSVMSATDALQVNEMYCASKG